MHVASVVIVHIITRVPKFSLMSFFEAPNTCLESAGENFRPERTPRVGKMLKSMFSVAVFIHPSVAYFTYVANSSDAIKGSQCVSLLLAVTTTVSVIENKPLNILTQCQTLSQTPLEVYFPNTTSYTSRIEHIWSVDASLPPACFVLPRSSEETASIIREISRYQCPFGIVSGGHSDFAGSNSIEAGVTIDFGRATLEQLSISLNTRN